VNTLVFDIETVPDVEAGRRLFGLDGLSEAEAGLAMMKLRRDETEGRSDFLKPHLQRVVAISVLLETEGRLRLWSLGEPDSPEAELIQRFFDGIDRYTPVLVSWNGSGFDLPVLHHRGLFRGCVASRYFETGEHETSFRYNNYLARFHWRHIDLMDVLAGYQGRSNASLDDTARLLGLPGKLDMEGSAVRERWLAGDVEGIRDYCETDVLNTWLVYLAFQRLRGQISRTEEAAGQRAVRDYLEGEAAAGRAHLAEYLAAWPVV
jgi:predicted PolB exonuclease-like 3'-5' exonuclease